MENYECAVGRTTKDYDADYERVAGRNGLDQAYGYDVPEKNGEQENHSLCGGRKAKLYYSDMDRKEAVIQEEQNFLNRVFKGNRGLMMTTMLEQEKLTDEDIDELIRILEKRKGE